MRTSNQAKVAPYILVVPSPRPPPFPTNEQVEENQNNWKRNRGAASTGCKCDCLSLVLGSLALTTLLIAAVAVPIIVILSISKTGTTSTASTTPSTTTLAASITTYTTSTTSTSTSISISTSTSTSTSTTTTSDIPCPSTCPAQHTCVRGVCVGTGYLSCTLTWSLAGDGDIVVATPNSNIICYTNRGPAYSTDYGELDVDDQTGTGPENVYWSSSNVPPTGVYYVCFSQYNFVPSASSTNPITATVQIARSGNITLTFTKTFTSYYKNYATCDSSSGGFLGSFTYP